MKGAIERRRRVDTSSAQFEKERIDRHGDRRVAVDVKKLLRVEIVIALVDDAIGEIGGIGEVGCGKDSEEVFADAQHVTVVSDIRIELLCGTAGWHVGEQRVLPVEAVAGRGTYRVATNGIG